MIRKFGINNFHKICDELALLDSDFSSIIAVYGYPPMWNRPNTFETLVHIILEQQVSLASALATLNKLRERVGEITPAHVLQLTDIEFRACYFSRQKTVYVKYLAETILAGKLDLQAMQELGDEAVRAKLTALKGIGNWTSDIYLIFVLQRADVFPVGDLAAVNALKRLKKLDKATTRETLLDVAGNWQPFRTIATMLLWHFYLSSPVRSEPKNTI